MHDIILAKQIIEKVAAVAKEKKIDNIKSVSLEIGSVALSHNDTEKHIEEINPGNLKFILEKLALNYGLDKAMFNIKKVPGDSWRIREIETK